MIGVDIVKDKVDERVRRRRARPDHRDAPSNAAVLFLGCGPSTIRLCPPLVVTKEEADVALDVLEECIREVGK